MNKDHQSLKISDQELVEYLNITYKLLSTAKTEIDIKRLKSVINALKNNEYVIVHEDKEFRLSSKKDYLAILDYIEKHQNGQEVTQDETNMFEQYCKENTIMRLVVNRSYDELFKYLSDSMAFQKNELSIVYQFLTGKKVKSIKTSQMIDEIKGYIYKLNNFDDMDEKFKTGQKK